MRYSVHDVELLMRHLGVTSYEARSNGNLDVLLAHAWARRANDSTPIVDPATYVREHISDELIRRLRRQEVAYKARVHRDLLVAQFEPLYRCVFTRGCFYCGAPSCEQDHAPALANVERHGVEYFREHGCPFLIVEACRKCNRTLGSRELHTLKRRTLKLFSLAYRGDDPVRTAALRTTLNRYADKWPE